MLIVQKYGGTSVGDIERIKNVARRVVKTANEGNQVLVVVSAMAGETDRLIKLAYELNQSPPEREMDLLLSSTVKSAKLSHTVFGDLVGPICESGDFIAKERVLPALKRGDLFAVMSAGAYGFAMSSNYNSRPRAAEVLVNGKRMSLIRRRETYDDLDRNCY